MEKPLRKREWKTGLSALAVLLAMTVAVRAEIAVSANDGKQMKDGDTVTNPFRVQFGLSGMGVAPAGVDKPNTGHHHLLIDVNEPLDPNEPIPQDKTHLHFGAGQTEALIELTPGKHTLQLVLGDWSHLPFHPSLTSDVITVTVK